MCRSTAAPLMAMAGMAGTAVGIAFAVIREKADRRSIQREIDAEEGEIKALDDASQSDIGDQSSDDNQASSDDRKPGDG